jgi:hypothetical protein
MLFPRSSEEWVCWESEAPAFPNVFFNRGYKTFCGLMISSLEREELGWRKRDDGVNEQRRGGRVKKTKQKADRGRQKKPDSRRGEQRKQMPANVSFKGDQPQDHKSASAREHWCVVNANAGAVGEVNFTSPLRKED